MSNLTTLTGGQSFGIHFAQALSGGQVDLSSLANYTGGAFRVVAEGAGGWVDLTSLTELFSDANSTSHLDMRNQATIKLDNLTRVNRVEVYARGAGTVFESETLIDINSSSLIAEQGRIRLPNVVSYQNGSAAARFQATGAGSLIDLPNLQTIRGGTGFVVFRVEASSGGVIDLDSVFAYLGDATSIFADGAGSVVRFTGVPTFFSDQGELSTIDVRNGGTIWLAPTIDLVRVNVDVRGGGILRTDQLQLFNGSTLRGLGVLAADVLNASGIVAPGIDSEGTLTIDGNYRQLATARLDIQVFGTTSDKIDHLIVTGSAQLDGTLNITRSGNFTVGQVFDIVTAATLDGVFSSVLGDGAGPGARFLPTYGVGAVRLATVDANTLRITNPVNMFVTKQSLTSLELNLTAAVVGEEARNAANYELVRLGANPVSVPVTSSYTDGATKITLSFPALEAGEYLLIVRSGNPGLRDLLGNPLDGNADGIHGGDYALTLTVDTTRPEVDFAELDGQTIRIDFIEDVGLNPTSVVNALNYTLVASGGDGIFGNGNDIDLTARIGGRAFDAATSSALLSLLDPIRVEAYRLVVRGTIADQAGNAIGEDFVIVFDLSPGVPGQSPGSSPVGGLPGTSPTNPSGPVTSISNNGFILVGMNVASALGRIASQLTSADQDNAESASDTRVDDDGNSSETSTTANRDRADEQGGGATTTTAPTLDTLITWLESFGLNPFSIDQTEQVLDALERLSPATGAFLRSLLGEQTMPVSNPESGSNPGSGSSSEANSDGSANSTPNQHRSTEQSASLDKDDDVTWLPYHDEPEYAAAVDLFFTEEYEDHEATRHTHAVAS